MAFVLVAIFQALKKPTC